MRNVHGEMLYQFLKILEMTDYAKILWLENTVLEADTERLYYTFDNCQEESDVKMHWRKSHIEDMLETIREQGLMLDFSMKYSENWMDEDTVVITWELRRDTYYAPLYMTIRNRNLLEAYAETKEYPILEDQKPVQIPHLPLEYIAVEHIYEMFKNLELIGSMSHYLEFYEALGTEAFSGRKMQMMLKNILEQRKLSLDQKRIDAWKSYENYPYMRKRYISYARKKSDATWEEVFGRIQTFLLPILEAIVKEEIFFGDWMPNLGRYLD